jgi:hypothetical protein
MPLYAYDKTTDPQSSILSREHWRLYERFEGSPCMQHL